MKVVGLGVVEGDDTTIITEKATNDPLTAQEQDAITLAKCYFDVREYRCPSTHPSVLKTFA